MIKVAGMAMLTVFMAMLLLGLSTIAGCASPPADNSASVPAGPPISDEPTLPPAETTLPPTEPTLPTTESPLTPTEPSLRQTLKIVIYTDFQCGACEKLHSEIEPELRARYVVPGKAHIETRLLGALGIDSLRAAQAALCAGDQGRFVEYQDALFRAWREEDAAAYSAEALTRLATSLGLDEAAFTNCLNSEAKRAEVEENLKMAQTDGVHTLPSFIVGDFKIEGYRPLDTYILAIEKVLATQPP